MPSPEGLSNLGSHVNLEASYSSSRLLVFPGNGLENALAKSRVNGQAMSFPRSGLVFSPDPSALHATAVPEGSLPAAARDKAPGRPGSRSAPSQPFLHSCPHPLPLDSLLLVSGSTSLNLHYTFHQISECPVAQPSCSLALSSLGEPWRSSSPRGAGWRLTALRVWFSPSSFRVSFVVVFS